MTGFSRKPGVFALEQGGPKDDPFRIRTSLMTIANQSTPHDFQVIVNGNPYMVGLKLEGYQIAGVPTTGGLPDNKFYIVSAPSLIPVDATTAANFDGTGNFGNGDIVLPLTGEDTTFFFDPPKSLFLRDTPFFMHTGRVTVSRPDRSLCVASDLSSLLLIFRVYQDLKAPHWDI